MQKIRDKFKVQFVQFCHCNDWFVNQRIILKISFCANLVRFSFNLFFARKRCSNDNRLYFLTLFHVIIICLCSKKKIIIGITVPTNKTVFFFFNAFHQALSKKIIHGHVSTQKVQQIANHYQSYSLVRLQ